MTHPYQPSEKPAVFRFTYADGSTEFAEVDVRGQLDAFIHDVPWRTDEYFTASQLAAEVERAVAAERKRISEYVENLICPCCHSEAEVEQAAYIAQEIATSGADDATGT